MAWEPDVQLVVDTDIYADCDDVAALVLANTFHNLGEARLLAVLVNTPSRYGTAAVHAINRAYGNGDVPVGALKPVDESVFEQDYAKALAETLGDSTADGSRARDAVDVYREVLASAQDNSVTIASIGFLTNLAALLDSKGDAHCELSGIELVQQKVARLIVMGGHFPEATARAEFNFAGDVLSAQHVVDDWPTETVFLGWELGADIYTGGRFTTTMHPEHPARMAYERFVGPRCHRHSWDPLTVYFAVRGEDGLLAMSESAGRCSIESDGKNRFHPDAAGPHRYLVKEADEADVARSLEALLVQSVARKKAIAKLLERVQDAHDDFDSETDMPEIKAALVAQTNGDDARAEDLLRAFVGDGAASSGHAGEITRPVPLRDSVREILDGPPFNSADLSFATIPSGEFVAGSETGYADERPLHRVRFQNDFQMSTTPITNAQYEEFAPEHARLRNYRGWSRDDDEPVLFVSWDDAVAFTEWLSTRDGRSYRLPTEAEWEYAATFGVATEFSTGKRLQPEQEVNQQQSWFPGDSRGHVYGCLAVGQSQPNTLGLYDLNGLVEEWTQDWYGPYPSQDLIEPPGPDGGDFRVTRGGSHSTTSPYLRSSARAGMVPEARNWLIGFRVVRDGSRGEPEDPSGALLSDHQRHVPFDSRTDLPVLAESPIFDGPRWFMHLNPERNTPFGNHNHQPAVTELANGDLLAIWFSTWVDDDIGLGEEDRRLVQLCSRLRNGADEWGEASVFFAPPARNVTGCEIWWDGGDTTYHWSGLAAAGTWGALALSQRTSSDGGRSWSRPVLINSRFGLRNQVVAGAIRTSEGRLMVAADAAVVEGGTAVHMSDDRGDTWFDPGAVEPTEVFADGAVGNTIAGIHASLVELSDGRILALGRGQDIDGQMPASISVDGGLTWRYMASGLDPVRGAQRSTMLRLEPEGAIMVASFTPGMTISDAAGRPREVKGLYTALSHDDGRTWSNHRLVTDDGPPRELDEGGMRGRFVLSPVSAERFGYLASTRTHDGFIHLVSSGHHYVFNYEWLTSPPAGS